MTQLDEYANRYRHVAFDRRDGVLEVRLHTDGGPMVWSPSAHRELADAYGDIAGDPETKLSRLTAAEASELISSGAASGGMIPKLQSIIVLLERGVHSAHIISGTKRNALLSEIFTDKGTGTMVVA